MIKNPRQKNKPILNPGNVKAAVFFNGECKLPDDFFRINTLYADFDFFCADGGADIALKFGIIPQIVVGDMDSISPASRRKLETMTRFIEFPAEKDKSDGELLLEMLCIDGYTDIHIFAATGGRMDQTLFNTQLLQRFPSCRIITQDEEIFSVQSGATIQQRKGWQASIIPVTPVVNDLSTSGFKFNLKLATITYGSTLTLSNVIISNDAKVTYRQGSLLIVLGRPSGKAIRPKALGLKLIKGKKDR